MELIKISDSKLKIALTPTDMEKYSLDIQTMDYDKTETRSAFWQLLDEAKHKTGFDAASEKIFVQIYSSAGGGCEMYVTKLKKTARNSDNRDYTCVPVNRNRPAENGGRNIQRGQPVQDGQNTADGESGCNIPNGCNMQNRRNMMYGHGIQDKQNMSEEQDILDEQGILDKRDMSDEQGILDERDMSDEQNMLDEQDMLDEQGALSGQDTLSEQDVFDEQDMQDGCCESDEVCGKNPNDTRRIRCNGSGQNEQSGVRKRKASNAVLSEFSDNSVLRAMSEVRCICRVSALDELLQLCLYAEKHLDVSESSAYLEKTSDGKNYYLVFSYRIGNRRREDEIPESLYLSEFGSIMKEKTGVYISEHCQCLCEKNAVKTLAALL